MPDDINEHDDDELLEGDDEGVESPQKPTRESISERIKRTQRKTRERVEGETLQKLATLGITSWEELETIQKEREAVALASMTEKERLEKENAKLKADLGERDSALASLTAQVRLDKRKASVLSAASGCKYPEQAWLWLQANRSTELDQAQDDSGMMNAEAVQALVGEVAKAMPDLFRVSDVPTPSLPPRSTPAGKPGELSPAELKRQARKAGY